MGATDAPYHLCEFTKGCSVALVIKTIRGRKYRYLQHSYRENGKVRTKSKYLGPVGAGIRPRKMGATFFDFLANLAILGGAVLLEESKLPHYKEHKAYDREAKKLDDTFRALDTKYGISNANAQEYHQSRSRMPPEMREEYQQQYWAAVRAYHAEKAREHAPMKEKAAREWEAKLAEAKAVNPIASVPSVPDVSAPVPEQPSDQSGSPAPESAPSS